LLAGLKVFRDGDFQNLGFLGDSQQAKLVFLQDTHFVESLRRDPGVKCVVTTPDLTQQLGSEVGVAQSGNPRLAFARIHNFLAGETTFYGESKPTTIDRSAEVHERAVISETDVAIGPRCKIGANAWIGGGVRLHSDVEVQPGAALGTAGLQTIDLGSEIVDLTHVGGLVVNPGVLVMTNAVIAKALFRESTTIGAHARIGNLAFISHNVQVGARTIVGHHAVINGNVRIGEAVWIGPNATISNNLTVGAGAEISLGATVVRDVASGQRVSGFFATEHSRLLRHLATFAGSSRRRLRPSE